MNDFTLPDRNDLLESPIWRRIGEDARVHLDVWGKTRPRDWHRLELAARMAQPAIAMDSASEPEVE